MNWVTRTRNAFFWVLWDFSGLRWIVEKIRPPKKQNPPPSSFLIWAISIYVALFGFASQIYQSRVDKLEGQADFLIAQIESNINNVSQVRELQNQMLPIEPLFMNPLTVIGSFFGTKLKHEPTVDRFKKILKKHKRQLNAMDLAGVDLSNTNLSGAKLNLANLTHANLRDASLKDADLVGANLSHANVDGTNFRRADLAYAVLADLQNLDRIGETRMVNLYSIKEMPEGFFEHVPTYSEMPDKESYDDVRTWNWCKHESELWLNSGLSDLSEYEGYTNDQSMQKKLWLLDVPIERDCSGYSSGYGDD